MTAGDDTPRSRGFLSPSDRRYLRNPDQYANKHSRQSVNDRRHAITQRIHDTLLDFKILSRYLSEDGRRDLFDSEDYNQRILHEGMISTIAFIYELHEARGWDFGDTLSRAVAEMWENPHRDPSGKFLAENVEWEPSLEDLHAEDRIFGTAKEKFNRGDPLTLQEIGILVKRRSHLVDENLDVFRERLEEAQRERTIQESFDKFETWDEMFGPPEDTDEE